MTILQVFALAIMEQIPLSKATDTATKVKVLNASLHNEETLNLTWKLSKGETAVSLMNYQVMICDAKTNEELLEISLITHL